MDDMQTVKVHLSLLFGEVTAKMVGTACVWVTILKKDECITSI